MQADKNSFRASNLQSSALTGSIQEEETHWLFADYNLFLELQQPKVA